MNTPNKRQKVNYACQRCRQRKLGCDRQRPCQLCVRAGAQCIARHPSGSDAALTSASTSVDSSLPTGPLVSNSGTQAAEESVVIPDSSIVDLSALILSTMNLGIEYGQDTSALPGGRKIIQDEAFGSPNWRALIAVQMPDDATLIEYVDSFFTSVDWFMMVFHEPSFRRRFQTLLISDQVRYHEENFLWLCAVVMALGAKYKAISAGSEQEKRQLLQLASDLLAQVESRFLQLIGCATLEAVQICILMGSCLLFSDRPNVGMGISGAGVKIAQVIHLHRESRWRDTSEEIRETKRRTWWALEVYDKYIAVAFGRPCTIDDLDCSVKMISNIAGESSNHLLLCHEQKFRLYRIMGPFLSRRRNSQGPQDARAIHDKLSQWQAQLPVQLRIETYAQNSFDEEPSILQMQALALQLTYDNLQIILHRAAAFSDGNKIRATPDGLFALHHLTEAGIRTANLYKFSNVLRACRKTHADMHVGITLFTAGVVLCVVCLAQPLSATSQRAKTSIMHIIAVCKDIYPDGNTASLQSIGVLERLVAVVLQLEHQMITGKDTTGTSVFSHIVPGEFGQSATNAPSVDTAADRRQTLIGDTTTTDTTTSEAHSDFSSAIGVGWGGNPSLAVDFGFGEASQLWLWADDVNFGQSLES